MKILITGISGYIGSRLAMALVPEHQVYGLVREPVHTTYIHADTEHLTLFPYGGAYADVARAVQECRPDLVYHLAAYYTSQHGPEQTPQILQSNVVLGGYLLEAMNEAGCRNLVYASTVTEYGPQGQYLPCSLYAASKRAFQVLADYYINTGQLHMTKLILSDTYGPGDHRPKVLNLLRDALLSGSEMTLSSGEQDYDLVYIDDVVRAFILAGTRLHAHLETSPRTCYQICAQAPESLRRTAEQLIALSGQKETSYIHWGEIPLQAGAPIKALRVYGCVPGWNASVPLQEGLTLFWNETM